MLKHNDCMQHVFLKFFLQNRNLTDCFLETTDYFVSDKLWANLFLNSNFWFVILLNLVTCMVNIILIGCLNIV